MSLPARQSAVITGRRLTWREAGTGPALVLVHGIGGSSLSWEPQLEAFAATHRVIAWDAPGYGGSENFAAPAPRVDDYAASLAALLESLGVTRAHFVGHSLGAVMVAALLRGGRVTAEGVTFLHGVTGSGRLDPAARETLRRSRSADLTAMGMDRFARERGRLILGPQTPAPAIARAIEVMADVPEAGYLQAWEMMCAADIFADLPAIACPTLVICGSADPVAPEASCRAVAAAIPQARFELLPEIGHYASLEAPEVFNRLLTAFLAAPRAS